ncbi:hypothetical protein LSAT2_012020 [Lamellibrachia satsuma]|nr:hypothetical protein LSAT2_012020 [Lamellibrachia satsuma]
MQFNRCLDTDYGNIGCSVDVITYVDSRCSGRRRCQLALPDPVLDKWPRPCPSDLKAYLQVAYSCLKVQSGTEYCGSSEYTKVSQTNGFLSNAITEEIGLGSSNCPWLLKAEEGQQISISLWDFAVWSSDTGSISQQSPEKSGLCHIYAYVEEYGTGSSVTLCGGATRESVVYTSETNAIVVKLLLLPVTLLVLQLLLVLLVLLLLLLLLLLPPLLPMTLLVLLLLLVLLVLLLLLLLLLLPPLLPMTLLVLLLLLVLLVLLNMRIDARITQRCFAVTGCADFIASADMVVRRRGGRVFVKCKQSEETWEITCDGHRWLGPGRNCSTASSRNYI